MSDTNKTKNVADLINSTALKESGLTYIVIIAISISSLLEWLTPIQIVALCLSYLGVLLGGYIKKAAELRMQDILKKSAQKDEEILRLRSEIADLRVITETLVEDIRVEVLKRIPPEKLE